MADTAVERAPEHAQARDARGNNGASAADVAAKKRRALLIIGGIAGVLIFGVLLYVLLTAGKETTDDAQIDADVVPLAPHVGGLVAAVPVSENQSVKRGDVVVQIDDRDYQARLVQAQAELESVRAQAQAAVSAAADQLRRSEAQVNEAEGRVVVSRPVDASIAVAAANAAYQHARVKNSEAALTLANLNLEWTRIVAPDEGTVSRITGHVGALLSPGQTVAQFVPVRKYVTANFKETQIGKIHPGQPTDVHVDTYGESLHGKVESLSAGTGARFSLFPPDNATGNFVKVAQRVPVRIILDAVPPSMRLRAGQSVVVTVHVNK